MRLESEDSELPDNDLKELVHRDMGIKYIPKSTIHVQKYDMRQTRVYIWVLIDPYNNL
jgi:hypothetical protein